MSELIKGRLGRIRQVGDDMHTVPWERDWGGTLEVQVLRDVRASSPHAPVEVKIVTEAFGQGQLWMTLSARIEPSALQRIVRTICREYGKVIPAAVMQGLWSSSVRTETLFSVTLANMRLRVASVRMNRNDQQPFLRVAPCALGSSTL